MRRYFYDFEFLNDGKTITPISIGVATETGHTYYAVFDETGQDPLRGRLWGHDFIRRNVIPKLPILEGSRFELDRNDPAVKPAWIIRRELHAFFSDIGTIHPGGDVELWTDYGAYDHVALSQIWGTFQDRPDFMPMYSNDLNQLCQGNRTLLGPPLPEQDAHNALTDAMWIRASWGHYHHNNP